MDPARLTRLIDRVAESASAPKVIRAYHGSPYDFDRFDASKIGTGEGAQSYGHGLYFAGNEGVARDYRDRLKDLVDGPVPDELGDELQWAIKEIRSLAERRASAQGDEWSAIQSALDAAHARHQDVQHRIRVASQNPGRMYEVEIGHPEEAMLDLDAAVMSQPAAIQSALGEFGEAPKWFSMGQEGWSGKNAYTRMANVMASKNPRIVGGYHVTHDMPAASEALLRSGVPGVRYLDGGSRAAGQGTRNYVVFPGAEDSIRILRKFAVPGAVGVGAASMGGEE